MTSFERLELLASVADLYYIERRSQAEIAQRFGYSRSTISRLLTEAHQRQLVEIRINHPLQRDTDLEYALRDRFDLDTVLVSRRGSLEYERMLMQLGRMAAGYLDEVLDDPCLIGISWGTAVYEVVTAMRARRLRGTQVVQMIGGLGLGDQQIDGPGVAMQLAERLGGRYFTLNAPHIAADEQTRDSLLSLRAIRESLQLALKAQYAIVGIGSVDANRSSLLRTGYLTRRELNAIKASGAVGDICGTHFDAKGNVLDIDINHRVVGIDLKALRSKPCRVVAVSGGRVKGPAIAGALQGNLIDVLITDSNAAEEVLAMSGRAHNKV
ncbi:MAG: sugar-binding transcriptional regulator [Chloroflexota bacterium]|jgi:deoxyribonucleoside regulator